MAQSRQNTKDSYQQFAYRDKVGELEEILASLQLPDIAIDEAIRLHTRGKELAAQIESYLTQAENQVRQVTAGKDSTE